MKLHQIVLRNWRGVEERTVTFAPTGVTVVEGPNESGKSSLVEALDALFDHLDDSKKRDILAIKPVHKDAGAEVEAEIETGGFRFTYFKRFHKKPETRLTVTQPRAESLTGRDAHERAEAILGETVDIALWRALRIEQGQEVAQANLAGQRSLSAALDRAAGVARTGEAEETLFAAARTEFERYFTATGAARKETTAAEAEVVRLETGLAQDRADLARLVADVERSAQLDREAVEAAGVAGETARAEVQHEERLRDVERLAIRVREAKVALDAADLAARDAESRATERAALVEEDRAAAEASRQLAAGDDLAAPAFDAAHRELDAAEAALALASKIADEAERTATVRQQDSDWRKDALDLQLLGERRSRIDAADAAAADAESVLTKNVVTDEVLKKLSAAHLDAEKARAAFAAGSPEVHIRALADIEPSIAGATRTLAAGAEATIPVAGSLALVLPGVAAIDVRTGSSASDLRDALEKRTRQFAESSAAAGVESLDAAVRANAAWQAARRDLEARDGVLRDNLRDLTREQLAQKLTNLAPRVAGYPSARVATIPIPTDFDEAQDAARAAKSAQDAARKARAVAEKRREAARSEADRLRDERTRTELGRERARTQALMSAARLREARAKATDNDVAHRVESTREARAVAERLHLAGASRLSDAQPETARERAEIARAARKRADDRLRGIEDERIEVHARLKERGEAGLAERVDITETKLERARDDLARRRVHATAARLLFETLDAERAVARKAYVAPLRAQIERLGRFVYGAGFSVDLSDELQIASRTLDGRTVPFESLSGGAKEQLGVISRLACALTVADDDGVPVVFDDTLGNTDPARIEAMGALLAIAGKRCQIIVLTCVPDRFRHVGAATVVRMAGQQPVGEVDRVR